MSQRHKDVYIYINKRKKRLKQRKSPFTHALFLYCQRTSSFLCLYFIYTSLAVNHASYSAVLNLTGSYINCFKAACPPACTQMFLCLLHTVSLIDSPLSCPSTVLRAHIQSAAGQLLRHSWTISYLLSAA